MANIGSFKKVNAEFQGEIVTLSVQARGVRIVPEPNRTNDNAPSHRVFVGRAEIGAAWPKRSNEGRDYLSVKLDDPSFTAPIFANLFDGDDDTYNLIWSRGRRPNGTEQPPATPRPGPSGRGFRVFRVRLQTSHCTVPGRAGSRIRGPPNFAERKERACARRSSSTLGKIGSPAPRCAALQRP
jgi:uncharacterized protein (DUF736 family)